MKKKMLSIILTVMMVLTVPLCANATDFNSIITTGGLSISQIQAGGFYEISNNTGAYLMNSNTILKFNSAYALSQSGPFCWDTIPYNSDFSGVAVYGGNTSGFYYVKNRNIQYSVYDSTTSTWTNSTVAAIPSNWSTDFIYRMQYSSYYSGLMIQYRGTLYIYKNSTFQNLTSLPVTLPERATIMATNNGFYVAGMGGLYAYNPNMTGKWDLISSDDFSDTGAYTVTSDGSVYIYKIGGLTSGTTAKNIVRYDPIMKEKHTYQLLSSMQAPLAGSDGNGNIIAVKNGIGNYIPRNLPMY